MKITIETIKSMSQSEALEFFYLQFKDYAKKCVEYVAKNHDMSKSYCENYIASGLFDMFISRCEKLHESENGYEYSSETMLRAFFGTKKLVKKILAMTNYSSYFKDNEKAYNTSFKDSLGLEALAVYCEQIGDKVYSETKYKLPKYKKSKNKYSEFRNVKKVKAHIMDIIDVLEQRENRTHKFNLSLNYSVGEDGDEVGNYIKSYYPTPEEAFINKLSRLYSRKVANKLREDKKFDEFYRIATSEAVQNKNEQNFIAYFKKRNSVESLKTKEILYIVSNY